MIKRFILHVIAITLSLHSVAFAAEERPRMKEFRKQVSDLAAADGFSDNDAIQSAVVLLKILEGGKPDGVKLSSRVSRSDKDSVVIHVAYDYGAFFHGYEVEFKRSERVAEFVSLKVVPSE